MNNADHTDFPSVLSVLSVVNLLTPSPVRGRGLG